MNAIPDMPKPARAMTAPKSETYDARDLIKDGAKACIVLDGQAYYLRITRAAKLILTK